jgi:hypothetical protein
MALEFAAIAASAVKIISPFMPFLLDAATSASQKLGEAIGQHGGEAAWNKAKTVWEKLTGHYGKDPEVKSLATLVSTNPADESYQALLAKALGKRLEQSPDFAQEILNALGGQRGIQEVLADKSAFVKDVKQRMATPGGRQTIRGGENSTIINVDQSMG